ncbi:uncharacterized protein LOC118420353 [Branchiostoma floridae]|uniref:Uncharacterized protein LOC118420353 n=1 Tax=Branchiostoma floridae TaxID=7739 RepID=A0A9J7LIE1_BRAFL|nr:uncharacterized protein LOC118420353 [Branchiostoma floridae]XP_035683022.1 uncharacterized protein LOC118420353 [Branchiostoma floridae]
MAASMNEEKLSKFFGDDDKMDWSELENALKSVGLNPSPDLIMKVRRKADANKDQKLTKEELSNILAVFEEIEDLRKIFVENDKDDSGTMSFMEMIKKAGDFYGKHADKYGGGKAKAVMDKYAGDRGKEMTVNEFLDIMFAGLLN